MVNVQHRGELQEEVRHGLCSKAVSGVLLLAHLRFLSACVQYFFKAVAPGTSRIIAPKCGKF